jgi:hypothetical protein
VDGAVVPSTDEQEVVEVGVAAQRPRDEVVRVGPGKYVVRYLALDSKTIYGGSASSSGNRSTHPFYQRERGRR